MLDIMNYYSCISTVEQFLLKTNLTEIDEMQLYFYNIISVTIVKQTQIMVTLFLFHNYMYI